MTLLLTSFAPWKAHQNTNSSDDLITLLQARQQLPQQTALMRHLPVHFQLAPCQVISALFWQRPDTVVCCGMAEKRSLLNLEQYAHRRGERLETTIDLQHLCLNNQWTTISQDAGNYVCNALYFQLLSYIQQRQLPIRCLFVHIPPLTAYNREPLAHDLAVVLSRLASPQLRNNYSAA